MRHQSLIAIALLLATSITGFGNSLSEEQQRGRLQVLRSGDVRNISLTPLDRAYLDARTLLDHNSTCSQFYGGSASEQVLVELAVRLRTGLINDTKIGIKMSGSFTWFVDSERGISYRLFEEAEINSIGPFYRSKIFPAEPFVPNVGSFHPNTREARILILLHELAHLIKGRNGMWLIPDDGGNPRLSHQNTLTVESRCGEEIRAL